MALINILKIGRNIKHKYLLKPTNCRNIRCFCDKAVDVNTNVVKDVILYKYTNGKFFKVLNVFAISQFGFWMYLSHFAYTNLRNVPVDDSKIKKWYESINLGDKKYRNGLTITFFAIGLGILSISWLYILRSVQYLILHKGGKEITIVTYKPFYKNRMCTFELKNLNCKLIRQEAKSQLPVKVKGQFFHYILDMKGEFKNTNLFDHTVGLRRALKN